MSEAEEIAYDLTSDDCMTKYQLAAEIANKALDGVLQKMVAEGKLVGAICGFGDALMNAQVQQLYKKKKSMEKGIAFPTCVSVNECVCHNSPDKDDDTELKNGDMVKIDMGVSN